MIVLFRLLKKWELSTRRLKLSQEITKDCLKSPIRNLSKIFAKFMTEKITKKKDAPIERLLRPKCILKKIIS